ncbi:MAG: hypothetical protein KME64_16635 [Scytonematopsis contorta HA4267-MV1]|jgi:hypothetical protein|nr:hypothetical protein [Scytonematopsis contorta HA4267-MV1]
MNALEAKILEILNQGTPLRAVSIAQMLGVERREVNHYLYSSLKHLVIQDNDYKWSLKTNKVTQHQANPPTKEASQSSKPNYNLTRKEIRQNAPFVKPNAPIQPSQPIVSTPKTQPYQPVRKVNPYEIVQKELYRASAEEKVKIIETAFRQDTFQELEDEQINALQSILEQSRREVSIKNTAYQQGQISSRKSNILTVTAVSIALAASALFITIQMNSNSTYQPNPTVPQNR